jgi:hypothetical protein
VSALVTIDGRPTAVSLNSEEDVTSSDGWVPEHARIDWVTLEGPALKLWQEKFGDRDPKLPAALVLPKWWMKEFGDRWGWDPTRWVTGPVTLAGVNGVRVTFNAPRWEWLRGKWAPLDWSPATDPKGLLALLAPLPVPGIRNGKVLGSAKYRPPVFSVMSQSLRAIGNEIKTGQLDWEAAADRAVSFNWGSAFQNSKVLESFLNNTSIEKLRRDLDRLDKALDILIPQTEYIDSSIYRTTQTIATGKFTSPSTSSAVAHSTRWLGDPPTDEAIAEYESWKRKPKPPKWKWKDLSNRRKNLWGCNDSEANEANDDFHDRMTHQATLVQKPKELRDCVDVRVVGQTADGQKFVFVNAERDDELAAKFKAHAAVLEVRRREHDERVNVEEKDPIDFSETLMDEWNKRLAEVAADAESAFTTDRTLGVEHTGFETLKLEELRSLKYRKSRAIPRYKNELVADLDKQEEQEEDDDEAEELPAEDTIPDEDEVTTDVDDVEPEDDEDRKPEDDEELECFSESESETSEGTSYNNDPRFSDDEEAVGRPEGHDFLVPDHEDNLRETHEDRQYTHEELEYVRRHIDRVKKDNRIKDDRKRLHIPAIVHETVFYNRTIEEAIEIAGVDANPKTAQKWKERFVEEAEMLKDSPDGTPYVEISDEMLDDLKSGGAYVKLDLGNGWRYHRLDTENYDDLDAAKRAMKVEKILAAWKESDFRKRTRDFTKCKEELQKIKDRFDQRFKDAPVIRDPNQWPRSRSWRGLLGDLAGREGKE